MEYVLWGYILCYNTVVSWRYLPWSGIATRSTRNIQRYEVVAIAARIYGCILKRLVSRNVNSGKTLSRGRHEIWSLLYVTLLEIDRINVS